MIVAIDGPAGAGKSSVARAVAERLGFTYLDTGALYRSVALRVLEEGIDPSDPVATGSAAEDTSVRLRGNEVFIDDRVVTARIREHDITELVSVVAAHPEVRAALLRRQKEAAAAGDVVIEGRDIGTAVAPDAPIKVFLTASPLERARRRAAQLGGPQDPDTLAGIAATIEERDLADSSRAASPLTKAPDAVVLDTTEMSQEAVVDAIVALVERGGAGG